MEVNQELQDSHTSAATVLLLMLSVHSFLLFSSLLKNGNVSKISEKEAESSTSPLPVYRTKMLDGAVQVHSEFENVSMLLVLF